MSEEKIYTPIPEALEEKGGKVKLSSLEILIYIGVGVIAAIAVVAFIYYFVIPNQVSPDGSVEGVDLPEVEEMVLEYSIELGNGTVINSGTEAFLRGYVGATLGLSDKIDKSFEGLGVGEDLEVQLSSEEAFGEYDEELITEINRTEKMKRRNEIKKEVLLSNAEFNEQFEDEPIINKTYEVEGFPWDYRVVEISDDGVTVSQEAKVGDIIPVSEIFFMAITEVQEDKVIAMLSAEDQVIETPNGNLTISSGEEYLLLTLTPTVGQMVVIGIDPSPSKVVSFDDKKIVLDYNSEYVGKDIVFKAKILE